MRFTHLLDDAKSTCSTASSSIADSHISRDSYACNNKFNNNNNATNHSNTEIITVSNNGNTVAYNHETDQPSIPKAIVEQLVMFSVSFLFVYSQPSI